MYVGHFAIGLALKARFPKIPTLPLLMGWDSWTSSMASSSFSAGTT